MRRGPLAKEVTTTPTGVGIGEKAREGDSTMLNKTL